MKYNFNQSLYSLDYVPIQDGTGLLMMGKVLANELVSQPKGDPIKFYDWGLRLFAGEEIELDESDKKKLYDFVHDAPTLTVLCKGQILKFLNSVGK